MEKFTLKERLYLILFLIFLGQIEGMAQKTTRTVQVGAWDDTDLIWDNGKPQFGDTAIIATSVILNTNINSGQRLGKLLIENGGKLEIPSTGGTLNTNLLVLNTGSILDMINGLINISKSANLSGGNFSVSGGNLIISEELIIEENLILSGGNINVSGQTLVRGNLVGTNNNTNLYEFTGGVTIEDGGKFDLGGDADVLFSGSIINQGTFSQAGSGTITLGSVNTITPTNPITFSGNTTIQGSNMVINGSAALTFQNNVTITGVTVNNNNPNVSILGNLSGSGTWANGANAQLTFSGSAISTVGFDASAAGNRVIYNAAAAQSVRPGTYHHLTLAGSNTKTLTGALTLNGNLTANTAFTVTGASTLSGTNIISGNAPIILNSATVQGNVTNQSSNLTIQGNLSGTATWTNAENSVLNYAGAAEPLLGGTLDADQTNNTFNYSGATQTIKPSTYFNLSMSGNNNVAGASPTLIILGNWNNTGTFNPGTGTVVFDGTGTQSITKTGKENFHHLTLLNDISINNGAILSGNLSLQEESILSTADTLVLSDATNILNTSTGFIDGWVRKNGLTDFTFPLGNQDSRGTARLFGFGNGDFRVRYFRVTPTPNIDAPNSDLFFNSNLEHWVIQSLQGSTGGRVELFWQNGTQSGITDLADLRISRWDADDQAWRNEGGTTKGTAIGLGSIESNPLNKFGIFTFSSANGGNTVGTEPILPGQPQLKSVEPDDNSDVVLQWSGQLRFTQSYTIERSLNNNNNFVALPGISLSRNDSSFVDQTAQPGQMYFYRVIAQNVFGPSQPSNTLGLVISGLEDNTLGKITKIYPNPVTESIRLEIRSFQNAKLHWEILDVQGRLVVQGISPSSVTDHKYIIPVASLASGTYYLKVRLGALTTAKKIVKE